jgi:glycosyltransferase involved in cell wall biosynthesis
MICTATTEPNSVTSNDQPSDNGQLRGKRVAMVMFSHYPADPRPRRAVDALVREGMKVDLICLKDEGSLSHESSEGVEVLRLPMRNFRGGKLAYVYQYAAFIFIVAAVFAWRALARGYDLVYVHNMPDILVLSALVPKALGAKVILDLHDPMPELMVTIFKLDDDSLTVRLLKRIEKWSIARANSVVTVNLTFKQLFSSRSCGPEKIEVVMNTPDGEIFPFHPPSLAPVKQVSDKHVIMYHGSLVERNGLDLAVEALARVKQIIPGAELRIYGDKTPFLDRVMETANNRGLRGAVRYLGPKCLEDLVHEIEDCDVGVIPNHRNSFTQINTPTRIFEYLALGKPVIAPRTQGVQDYFPDDSMIFFEAGDAAGMAKSIEYAFHHPAQVTEIVRRGQVVYRTHLWQKERARLVRVVAGLLEKNSTGIDPITEAVCRQQTVMQQAAKPLARNHSDYV